MYLNLNKKLKTLSNNLSEFVQTAQIYHYYVPTHTQPPYFMWMEDGEDLSQYSDDYKRHQTITGMLHYYTQTEYDEDVDNAQTALNSMDNVSWSLNSVQYEDTTGLIHYAWDFEVT